MMRRPVVLLAVLSAAAALVWRVSAAAEPAGQATKQKRLNVLFVGNSITACYHLAQVVKAMAEARRKILTVAR